MNCLFYCSSHYSTYNVDIHALPPAWQVVDARIVAEDVHGPAKMLLTPLVQGHEISPLRDVTAAKYVCPATLVIYQFVSQ